MRKGEMERYVGLTAGLKVRGDPRTHPTANPTARSIHIASSSLKIVLKLLAEFYDETSEYFNMRFVKVTKTELTNISVCSAS
jgi:hypothetical protein